MESFLFIWSNSDQCQLPASFYLLCRYYVRLHGHRCSHGRSADCYRHHRWRSGRYRRSEDPSTIMVWYCCPSILRSSDLIISSDSHISTTTLKFMKYGYNHLSPAIVYRLYFLICSNQTIHILWIKIPITIQAYFIYYRIDWTDKTTGITIIAKQSIWIQFF